MTKTIQRVLLSSVFLATACGGSNSTSKDGGAGSGGSHAGSTGTAGGAGSTAGATGTAGAGGSVAGSTGTAGADAAAGTTGTAGTDGGTDAPAATTDGGATTTNIKAATGGTVTAAGLSVVIPAGALAADTDITVAVSDGAGLPGASTLASSVYDLGPNGTTFLKPVTLTLDVNATKLGTKKAVVSFLNAGAWTALTNSALASGKASATTTHFTQFGVVGSDTAACLAQGKTACMACCKSTYPKGVSAPLNYGIQECGCLAGAPCLADCTANICMAMAPSAACQTCLTTTGNANNPRSACSVKADQDCAGDADCQSYALCSAMCTTAPTPDASAGDATTSDASTSDAAAVCVTFAENAPVVKLTTVALAAPAAAGGTIVPGVYWLTEVRTYAGTGATASTMDGTNSQTHTFTANAWGFAGTLTASGAKFSGAASYSVAGTTFTATRTCGSGNAFTPIQYTATATQVLMFSAAGVAQVLTLQ